MKKIFCLLICFSVILSFGCKVSEYVVEEHYPIYSFFKIPMGYTYYFLSDKGLMSSIRVKGIEKQGNELILKSEMKIGIFSNKTFIGDKQDFDIIVSQDRVRYLVKDGENYLYQTVIKFPVSNGNTWIDDYGYVIEPREYTVTNRIVSTNSVFEIYRSALTNVSGSGNFVKISNCVVIERVSKKQVVRNYFCKGIGLIGNEVNFSISGRKGKVVYRLYKVSSSKK
ncbi:MAG: hypothetical protein ABDH28_04890 [Brevinematia bacterium]